jgi:hypothetical protein
VHRNPTPPARVAQKGPENRPEPAIRRSKRPLEVGRRFNRKLRDCRDCFPSAFRSRRLSEAPEEEATVSSPYEAFGHDRVALIVDL